MSRRIRANTAQRHGAKWVHNSLRWSASFNILRLHVAPTLPTLNHTTLIIPTMEREGANAAT